jgi:hypothetical protein
MVVIILVKFKFAKVCSKSLMIPNKNNFLEEFQIPLEEKNYSKDSNHGSTEIKKKKTSKIKSNIPQDSVFEDN